MAVGAVLCLFLMLSGYAVAYPNWQEIVQMSQVGCESQFPDGCCQAENILTCKIRVHGQPTCYCDQGCHEREDCCDDIETIGCSAGESARKDWQATVTGAQCATAELSPGSCTDDCEVNPPGCFCDEICKLACDCCDDVPDGCYLSTRNSTQPPEFNNVLRDAETMERRLKHHLTSLQNYRKRLSTAQSKGVDNAEMLKRKLLRYLTSSQSYRRRPSRVQEDLEVELLVKELAERARKYISKKKN